MSQSHKMCGGGWGIGQSFASSYPGNGHTENALMSHVTVSQMSHNGSVRNREQCQITARNKFTLQMYGEYTVRPTPICARKGINKALF